MRANNGLAKNNDVLGEESVNFLCQITSSIRGGISEAKPDQSLNLKTVLT